MPDTSTTALMLDAARALGAEIARDDAHHLVTPALHTRSLGPEITDGQVGAVMLLAPILARRRHARLETAYPLSRLYAHLTALRDLGFDVHIDGDVIDFTAEPWERREPRCSKPASRRPRWSACWQPQWGAKHWSITPHPSRTFKICSGCW